MDYREIYEKWVNNPNIEGDERLLLKEMSDEDIHEAFYRTLEFGTGGMRGIMGLGTNRMNRYMVRMAAKAMADSVSKKKEKPKAVIAFDTRNNSRAFAEETAKVFASCGVRAYIFDRPSPVPLLSFAIRELGADCGVVITASHNTKEYNGFKAYDETGCQLLPDETEKIAEIMAAIDDPLGIETANMDDYIIDTGMIVPVGDEIIEKFQQAIEPCGKNVESDIEMADLNVIYTSLHGSGRDYVVEALKRAGAGNVTLVQEQADFNGNFPTVKSPNPENSEALAIAESQSQGADIILGTDPDCDRVGVGVVEHDLDGNRKVTYLTGNQIGVLLLDYLCSIDNDAAGKRVITTIVSSELGPVIARSKGVNVSYVLTGFKYIGGIMNQMVGAGHPEEFLMGYEESYGYLTGIHARDKDGVSAALTICRMAAHHKAMGRTLTQVIEDIYRTYGYWGEYLESLTFHGSEGEKIMNRIMEDFRTEKAQIFHELKKNGEDSAVRFGDFLNEGSGLPKADVLKYVFDDGSWVAVRPSGTEPKIKVYYCMRGNSRSVAEAWIDAAAACVHTLTGAYS